MQAANRYSGFFLSSQASPQDHLSSREHGVIATSLNRQAWEVWQIYFVEPGCVVFQSTAHHHGQYLMCPHDPPEGDEAIPVDWSSEQDATHWLVRASPRGDGICFVAHGKLALSSSQHGHVDTKDLSRFAVEESETFLLVPNMPKTISGPQIFGILGAGILGVATIVAAPRVVVGVVGAMGFGSAGIAAGSMAAGLMSAEALASGGAIAAGGTVATLQSIGAAGLGAAGTAAAMGGGALVGGGVTAITTAGILASASNDPKGTNHTNLPSNAEASCYYAGWKYW